MNKIIRYFKFQWSFIKGYLLEIKLKIKKILNECYKIKYMLKLVFGVFYIE